MQNLPMTHRVAGSCAVRNYRVVETRTAFTVDYGVPIFGSVVVALTKAIHMPGFQDKKQIVTISALDLLQTLAVPSTVMSLTHIAV